MLNLIKLLIVIVVITLSSSSCKKETTNPLPSSTDYVVVGRTSGWCRDCIDAFKLDNIGLYPDESLNSSEVDLIFSNKSLGQNKIQIAKKEYPILVGLTKSIIPKTYGCPGCADGPGIYIEIKENGIVKKWHIDYTLVFNNQEPEVHALANKGWEIIEELTK
jgi:hypothetical protein